jgi:hypothetical protein
MGGGFAGGMGGRLGVVTGGGFRSLCVAELGWNTQAQWRSSPSSWRGIYIGETTGQTLDERIRQFIVSADTVKPGHSGGNSFRTMLSAGTPKNMLLGSACPVEMGEVYTSAYIKYLERRLLWEHVATYGERTACNST